MLAFKSVDGDQRDKTRTEVDLSAEIDALAGPGVVDDHDANMSTARGR
jgi:hypothetical protein